MPGYHFRRSRLRCVSFVALFIAAPLGAHAAEAAPNTVEEVVATATRAAGGADADRTGASITAVKSHEFEERQVRIGSQGVSDTPRLSANPHAVVAGDKQGSNQGTESNP